MTKKPLQEITLEDAFNAYKKVSRTATVIRKKRLSEDYDGFVTLQRMDVHKSDWTTVVVFHDGYAYCYGGDSPERFEKNILINYHLLMLGYDIHFDHLNIPKEVLYALAGIPVLTNSKMEMHG